MANPDFDGTALAAAHIGDARANKLAKATESPTEPLKLSLVAGDEAANVIRLSFQAKDRDDVNIAEAVSLHVRVYDAAMIEALAAAFTLSQVANEGTVDSTDAQAAVLLTTEADGSASLDLTDVVGASGATVNVIASFIGREGSEALVSPTFD